MNYRLVLTVIGLALGSLSLPAQSAAVNRIEIPGISGLNQSPIPVNLSGFTGEALEVIQFDLIVQGFSLAGADSAQYLLSGSNGDNLVGRAQDRINNNVLVNKSYSGANLRRQAHQFVDDFLAALGRKGIGNTKIAFSRSSGSTSEIYIANFDGSDAAPVTQDNSTAISPAWAPGNQALCYTSYRSGGAWIYLQNLAARQRKAIASYPGSNFSPAVSPDGNRIAMILSKSGTVDLYVANLDGNVLNRLTQSREDESSPCWSPDGQWICYAGKINEARALYKISPTGGKPQRISTSGILNPTEPDWSPDGKWIIFTQQRRGGFDICIVSSAGGSATVLVEGEDPSWAPNSRTVVYTRRSGRNGNQLSLLDVPTKQTKTITRISGSSSQPSWAK